jgi:hypothetical protein
VTNRTRWLVTVAVATAVVLPAVLPGEADGFPISTYPMFTAERGRVMALDTVVLVDGERRERLSPEEIGGTDEIVLAAVTVNRAISAGGETLERLCTEIAARIDRPGTVEIVTETHDTVALLQDDAAPSAVQVHERCPSRR